MLYNYFDIYLKHTTFHTENRKKAFFALLCSIFYYNNMEDEERSVLVNFSKKFDGELELKWACEFVKEDVLSAFTRSKEKVSTLLILEPEVVKLEILNLIWETTKNKGYITALEAQFLLNIAKEWKVETEFIHMVREAS